MKDCDVEGEEICSTHYESECWTQNTRQEVSDDVPECLPVQEQESDAFKDIVLKVQLLEDNIDRIL